MSYRDSVWLHPASDIGVTVGLFRRQCDWPDCEALVRSSADSSSGQCSRHGSWVECHKPHVRLIGKPRCPLCRWEDPDVEDWVEADRRTAADERREHEAVSKSEAVFRAQGFDQAAARAMANKQFRENQPAPRKWYQGDIRREREEADRQRRIAAGELVRCPACGMSVRASQHVILGHDRGGWDDPYIACEGEGTVTQDA